MKATIKVNMRKKHSLLALQIIALTACLSGCASQTGTPASSAPTQPKKTGDYSHLSTAVIVPEQKTLLSLYGNERFSTLPGLLKVEATTWFSPQHHGGARFDGIIEDGSKVFVIQPKPAAGVVFQSAKGADLAAFQRGAIKFEIKTAANPDLALRLQDASGNSVDLPLKSYLLMNNRWERVNIPLKDIEGLDFSRLVVPFGLVNGDSAIALKNIHWLTDGALPSLVFQP